MQNLINHEILSTQLKTESSSITTVRQTILMPSLVGDTSFLILVVIIR